jgi:hypothetical protein
MKKIILLILFISFSIAAKACVVYDANGDLNCVPSSGVSYTIPSTLTLTQEDQAQTVINTANQNTVNNQQLIAQDEQNLAIQDLQSQGILSADQVNALQSNLTVLTTAKNTIQSAQSAQTAQQVSP